jgi:hypothetical protein
LDATREERERRFVSSADVSRWERSREQVQREVKGCDGYRLSGGQEIEESVGREEGGRKENGRPVTTMETGRMKESAWDFC